MMRGDEDAVVVVGDVDGFATGILGVFAGDFDHGHVGVVVADLSAFFFKLLGKHVTGGLAVVVDIGLVGHVEDENLGDFHSGLTRP